MIKVLIGLVYVVIGVVVAAANDYFTKFGSIKGVASAVLAVLLWPLVLLGVDLHLGTLDADKRNGREGDGGGRKDGLLLPLAVGLRMLLRPSR